MRILKTAAAVKTIGASIAQAALVGIFCVAHCWADEAADVGALLKSGKVDEAARRADAFLAAKPRDAQFRFLKGLILTRQGRAADAIPVFAQLTEDFPELAEPHNNLAVLYASDGRYDKARSELESAIRVNPNYATAYENLGDVYARLAGQAYGKSAQLDPNNAALKSKLDWSQGFQGLSKQPPRKTDATVAPPIKK